MQLRPAPSESHSARVHEQAARRRLLYGAWRTDLEGIITEFVGRERREAWGRADLGANLLLAACKAQSTLYDRPFRVAHDDARSAEVVSRLLGEVGWQSMGQRVQRDTLGIREMHVYLDVRQQPDGSWRLIARPVWPDEVEADAAQWDPERPEVLSWWQVRRLGGREVWTRDVWDLRDPSYRVLDERGEDITPMVIVPYQGPMTGDQYPYRDERGIPYIPVATYHAERTGQLYDYTSGREAVEGTYMLGVFWTMFGHVMRSSSWLQRYTVGLSLAGLAQEGDGATARREVHADPAKLLEFVQDAENGGSGSAGAFPRPIEPQLLAEAIAQYERRVLALVGLNPADVQRVSGDPRSGYALAISRAGQIEAQRRYAPVFGRGDEELCAIVARLWRSATGEQIQTSGYRVSYGALEPSPEEMQQLRQHVFDLLDRGLMSPVEAYQMLHPGMAPEDAVSALEAIAESKAATADEGGQQASGVVIEQASEIARSVVAGEIPPESGRAILISLVGLAPEQADAILPRRIDVRPQLAAQPAPEPTDDAEPGASDDPA